METTDFSSISSTELWRDFFLSLLLFSRYSHAQRFPLIMRAIHEHSIWVHDEHIFLDLETRKNQVQRLAIDPITALIGQQLIKKVNQSILTPIPFTSVKNSIERFLEKEASTAHLSYQALIRSVRIDCQLFTPGILSAVQSGMRKTASLQPHSFLRVLTGTRLNLYETSQAHHSKEAPNLDLVSYLPSIMKSRPKSQEIKTLKKLLRKFRAHLHNRPRLPRHEITSKLVNEFQNLDHLETPPAQIIYLLGIWAVERLNSAGEKKAKLDFSTVYDYFLMLDSRLLEHFKEVDIVNEEVEMLLDVYNTIIRSHHNDDQTLAASQILNFHNQVCSKYFGMEEIKKEDLEFESGEQEQAIDANFITPFEKNKIDRYLTTDGRHPRDLQLQLSLILALYSKLGFRPNELFKLELKDVFHHGLGYKGYITCRHNRLDGLKNPQSHRNALTIGKLKEAEQNTLQKWIKIRAPQSAEHFWIYDPETKQQKKRFFQKELLDAVRIVTGDPSLKVKSLRHTAATIEYISYFQHIADFLQSPLQGWIDKIGLEEWFSLDTKDYISRLYASPLPSRRFAYRVAQSMGHSGPGTSLTNYSHFYEFVMPYFHRQDLSMVTNRAIANLVPSLSVENLRNLKSRIKKKTRIEHEDKLAQLLLLDVARRSFSDLQNVNQELKKIRARGKLPLPAKRHTEKMGLIQGYEILSYLGQKPLDRQLVFERFNLEKGDLELLEKKYLELYERTGMNPLNWEKEDLYEPEKPSALKDSLGLIKTINDLMAEESHDYKKLLELWALYVDPNRTFWFLEKEEQQTTLTNLLIEVLGLPENQVVLTTSDDHLKGSQTPHFVKGIRLRRAKGGEAQPIPRLRQPHLNKKVRGVAVTNKADTRFLNQDLNILFFLSTLLLLD